jgi:hypothetical protein
MPTPPSPLSSMHQVFRIPRNIFGLVCQYFVERLPSVNPDEHITLADMSTSMPANTSHQPLPSFHPLPNQSSSHLGDWYWNGGIQKSQQSFTDLIDIVGDPSFHLEHVCHTDWCNTNAALGNCNIDGDAEGEWLDEDAGWRKTHVEITVPFHSQMKTPGA